MGMLEKLAHAETSSDLRHYPTPCAVDVLTAAGLAGIHAPIHLALYRLKYLNDAEEMGACKQLFIRWAYRSMCNRGVASQGASRLGVQALTQWVADVCECCKGRGFQIIPGAPSLSDRPCGACKGSGKRPIRGVSAESEVIRDVISRAESAINSIQERLEQKLRG